METAVINKLEEAAKEYIDRRDRTSHPDGKFDKASRWYPSVDEEQTCCTVRSPSRSYPFSLMVHCRTIKHIATKYGLSELELLRAVKTMEKGN